MVSERPFWMIKLEAETQFPPSHPNEPLSQSTRICSARLIVLSLNPLITKSLSNCATVANAQQLPHCPWSLTAVTAFLLRQSKRVGVGVDFGRPLTRASMRGVLSLGGIPIRFEPHRSWSYEKNTLQFGWGYVWKRSKSTGRNAILFCQCQILIIRILSDFIFTLIVTFAELDFVFFKSQLFWWWWLRLKRFHHGGYKKEIHYQKECKDLIALQVVHLQVTDSLD